MPADRVFDQDARAGGGPYGLRFEYLNLRCCDLGARRTPGDCNQDCRVDISDAICLLGGLFLGRPERLPCGDGSSIDPSNVKLLDWQGDDKVDFSDAVSVLCHLFIDCPLTC